MKLAVFDLDGTLVDSHPAIVGCFAETFARCGLPPVDEALVTSLIGLPLAEMFDRLLALEAAERRLEAIARYKEGYPTFDRRLSRVFPGIVELVGTLRSRGIRTAIATSKSRVGLDRVCDELGLASLFDARLSNDDVTRPKPHPEMLLAACGAVGVPAEHAVMIGDTSFDVGMGVAAGSRAIGVTWGAHDAERLRGAGAHDVVDDVEALAAALAARPSDPTRPGLLRSP